MTDQRTQTVETPTITVPRAWTDPACTEYAVDELTQAGAAGLPEAGIFS